MRLTLPLPSLLACGLLAAGCSQFPELDATVRPGIMAAPYPDLVPVETLTAQRGPGRIDADAADTLEARADRLRARAARLGRIDPGSDG